MKENRLGKILGVGAACVMAVGTVLAQESTTTSTTATDPVTGTTTTESTTTNSSGTIVNYSPGTEYFTFRSSASAEPARYYYSKKTTVVDPTGRTVEWSAVRPDMPATVYYAREGDRMVVTRVVLAEPVVTEKESTTTTTTTHP